MAKTRFLSKFLSEHRLKIASKYLAGQKVLDLGCQDVRLLEYLNRDVEYVGIDFIDFKKSKNKTFKFFKKDLEKGFGNIGKFDTIFMVAIIEHLKNYEKIINDCYHALNKNGVLVITTPSPLGDFFHHIGAKLGLTSSSAIEQHEHIFSLSELDNLLKNSKFEIFEKKYFILGLNQLIVGKKS